MRVELHYEFMVILLNKKERFELRDFTRMIFNRVMIFQAHFAH